MLQADDTWSGPNQTAATRAGSDRINTWIDYGFKKIKIIRLTVETDEKNEENWGQKLKNHISPTNDYE